MKLSIQVKEVCNVVGCVAISTRSCPAVPGNGARFRAQALRGSNFRVWGLGLSWNSFSTPSTPQTLKPQTLHPRPLDPKPKTLHVRLFCFKAVAESIWGSPKVRGTFSGVPIIRTIVYWGLHWGTLILGIYHLGRGNTEGFQASGPRVNCTGFGGFRVCLGFRCLWPEAYKKNGVNPPRMKKAF